MTTHGAPPAPPSQARHEASRRQALAPMTIGQRAWAFTRELLIVVVGAVVVSSLLRAFVGQMFIIPSQSMENTLLVGDRVVVQKLTDFQRGDVVVFSDPGGWLEEEPVADPPPWDKVLEFIGLPTRSTPGHLIKRVIGLPGDKVVCCTARAGSPSTAIPLTSGATSTPTLTACKSSRRRSSSEVVVPEDRIFVMGDHRDLSADSRCHLSDLSTRQGKGQVAFVPISLVVGPALRSQRHSIVLAAWNARQPSLGCQPRRSLHPRER